MKLNYDVMSVISDFIYNKPMFIATREIFNDYLYRRGYGIGEITNSKISLLNLDKSGKHNYYVKRINDRVFIVKYMMR